MERTKTEDKLIFSGVQPTGNLHLGNYLGAIRNWVDLQNNNNCIFCIVDLHAITTSENRTQILQNTREVAAAYIASGIDPQKNIIFVQSNVAGHSELSWLLSCHTPIGWLNRMTQFKDKAGKNKEKAPLGLYSYPVLMAADILLYKSTHVPVGEDQKQHLELTRDIAQKFNNDFETDLFPIPEPLIFGEATRVMSLRDGSKKMSKSDPSDYSRIMLTDTAENIVQKIKKAKTDPKPLPVNKIGLEKRPEAENLISIFASMQDTSIESVINEYSGKEFSVFKKDLADLSVSKLEPITSEMNRLMNDIPYIDNVLKTGKENAISVAEPVLEKTKEIIGFLL